jgi:hypothetical protein
VKLTPKEYLQACKKRNKELTLLNKNQARSIVTTTQKLDNLSRIISTKTINMTGLYIPSYPEESIKQSESDNDKTLLFALGFDIETFI